MEEEKFVIGMKRKRSNGKPHPASQRRMQHPTTELLDEQMINIVLDINWAIGNCQRHVAFEWSLRGIVSRIWPRYRTMKCGPTMQASTNGQPLQQNLRYRRHASDEDGIHESCSGARHWVVGKREIYFLLVPECGGNVLDFPFPLDCVSRAERCNVVRLICLVL